MQLETHAKLAGCWTAFYFNMKQKLLDTGFCLGLAEDMVGIFPWQDRGRWDIGNPGVSFYLHRNKPCHTTIPCVGPWKAFHVIPWKNPIPTNNTYMMKPPQKSHNYRVQRASGLVGTCWEGGAPYLHLHLFVHLYSLLYPSL